MLEAKLDDPVVALELLVAEAESGEPHPTLWEQLHAAALRDDKLVELGAAYEQLARGRRRRPLPPPDQPLPLEAGERLVQAGAKNPRVIAVIEAHFSRDGRFREAAKLLDLAIQAGVSGGVDLMEPRRRLVALYMGGLKTPEAAIPHVEGILRADWTHAEARKAAERLLGYPAVAGRAAAALQECRRRAQQES
jgi:hypothetical protein